MDNDELLRRPRQAPLSDAEWSRLSVSMRKYVLDLLRDTAALKASVLEAREEYRRRHAQPDSTPQEGGREASVGPSIA
jgi:hypothetical protein